MIAITTIELDGTTWYVPYRPAADGPEVYHVAILGASGGQALRRIIDGSAGPIEDREGFLMALEPPQ